MLQNLFLQQLAWHLEATAVWAACLREEELLHLLHYRCCCGSKLRPNSLKPLVGCTAIECTIEG